ncbi:MAG: acetyl-coenzyme A synthetase N-terminal domain-containing protein, partial [Nitrosopumilaceae archaeon]
MSNFEFIPTNEQKENSNIFRFMKKYKISSLEELSTKANNNLEWFWQAVEKEIEIVWDRKYETVLDLSKGLPWSRWFVGGKTNIYNSS